jgi:serine/threonine-protein kinase
MAEVCAALKQGLPANPDEKPSIAVLPFANIGRDDADEFFSDGLAEDVINALAKLPGLKVIARTSAFAFKGQNSDIRKIAETLGVANILEGSVRRSGSRVRVTAQLVAASDGSHLWSERYDRQLDDLFAMQDEIAESIAAELRLKFAPAEHPRRQPNLQAYEAYLRYRQYQWLFTPEAFARSRTCLEQAIALDPEYALAYAGLADHYFALTTLGNAGELVPKARSLAERALELDPDLSEAHGMLGVLAAYLHPDWDEAERRFVLATAREPVPWQVRSWHSTFFLRPLGRCAEAQREAERAIEDNPLSQMLSWALGNVLAGAGRPDEALSAYNKAAELDPQFWAAFWSRGMWHAVSGRQAEALANAEKAVSIFPNAYTTGLLAGLLHQGGEAARAEELLQRADTPASICYHTVRGDVDKAVELSCAALDEGHQILSNSFLMPFEPLLRQSSGWPTLMRKMNLPETR